MLTLETPATFVQPLKIVSLGQTIFFDVTYNNVEPADIDAQAKERGSVFTNTELLLLLVNAWDSPVELTPEGIAELEQKRPGITSAVIQGYFRGRVASIEKN